MRQGPTSPHKAPLMRPEDAEALQGAPGSGGGGQPWQLTSKLDVKLVLWLQDLHIERAVWGKIFHGPGSQDGLVVLTKEESMRYLLGAHFPQCFHAWDELLTAAVRSTSFRLLRMKQASPLSILQAESSIHAAPSP